MGVFKKVFGGKSGKHLKKKEKSQKNNNLIKTQKKVEKKLTFTKIAIAFVLINSEMQIWASYVLAFLGRDAIAEALSQQIVVTIIGTMTGYFVKSLVENLSKYTTLFGKNLDFANDSQNSDIIMNSDMTLTEVCNDTLVNSVEFNNSSMCDDFTSINTNDNIIV